ncbi:protein of unknown function [Aminobacter niigataensis]|nr:protein of unknown function [Aminobacter niigataensis]
MAERVRAGLAGRTLYTASISKRISSAIAKAADF